MYIKEFLLFSIRVSTCNDFAFLRMVEITIVFHFQKEKEKENGSMEISHTLGNSAYRSSFRSVINRLLVKSISLRLH